MSTARYDGALFTRIASRNVEVREFGLVASPAFVNEHTLGAKRPRPATGWEALTATERQVAALVAEGLTNIQCARELGIAANTVRAHLRHIYAKLDLRTRTALAAYLHRLERGPDCLELSSGGAPIPTGRSPAWWGLGQWHGNHFPGSDQRLRLDDRGAGRGEWWPAGLLVLR